MSLKGCLLYNGSLLLLSAIVVGVCLWAIGPFLINTNSPAHGDAILVLGGEGSDFPRTQEAIRLYQAGYAPVVIFSGGTMLGAGLACSSTQLSLEAAQQLGFPASAVLLAPEAQSTYDEAVNLRQLSRQHGWRSLILVTDPFHTRRTSRIFHTLLPDVTLYTVPTPNPRYDTVRWWQSEEGLLAVFSEVIKMGFYWAKYGIAPW